MTCAESSSRSTPQAFITTDHDNNQITAFHPGAMGESHQNHVRDTEGVTLGIVAPDGREGMLQNAREFHAAGIPFIFDPGQAMPLFNGEEFREFVRLADYVITNDYESSLLQERTGWSEREIARQVKAFIVTRGPKGCDIFHDDISVNVPPAQEEAVVDPTGCGDAFRAAEACADRVKAEVPIWKEQSHGDGSVNWVGLE